ncbi:glycosyltransferase family 4 protein [Paenibacillus thailandensis]|uniref:Glycosyltransferase family 4 protein n=1 Tax=Paenibacillus thailandensis TaxID=393250 RepID=A0ABW5QRV7_9BACL
MIICSVTTASHLFRAKIMAMSVKKYHPEAKVALLLIEKNMHANAISPLFDHVYLAKQIGVPDFDAFMLQRSIHEAAYSLKSHFIRFLFASFPEESDLIMLDTDMKLYGPMAEAMDALNEHPIVLTPHEIHDAKESFLFHGVYNIGFIALRRSEETFRFLDWWTSRVDRFGFDAYKSSGLFFEQNWLNLAPAFFSVHSLRHPGYNVAFWNLSERGKAISGSLKKGFRVDGAPLRIFHFSHAENALPGIMRQFVPNRKSAIYRLYSSYMQDIRKQRSRKYKAIQWSYDFDHNGRKISKETREQARISVSGDAGGASSGDKHATAKSRLRIVQVVSNVPNAYPLPPFNQGGTEKVVYDLTEELVKLGHTVYLYAAQGSSSSAHLIPYPKDLKEKNIGAFVAATLPDDIDIIHDHTFSSSMKTAALSTPVITSHHIPVRHQGFNPVYVSRNALRVHGQNNGRFVYNGINIEEYEYSEDKRDYLLFMGRIMKEKGVHHAIYVAEKANLPLKIAGPIKDLEYFNKELKPKITSLPNIEYIGAVGGALKQSLLKHAKYLLFPSLWEEPFGLTMIEAMACGTPVLALANGAVPEVLAGFPDLICHSPDEMFVKTIWDIPPRPRDLRDYVAQHFSSSRMAEEYEKLYRDIIPFYSPVARKLHASVPRLAVTGKKTTSKSRAKRRKKTVRLIGSRLKQKKKRSRKRSAAHF